MARIKYLIQCYLNGLILWFGCSIKGSAARLDLVLQIFVTLGGLDNAGEQATLFGTTPWVGLTKRKAL